LAAKLPALLNLIGFLRLQDTERPETPDALKKYRQSRLHEPGKIFRHFSSYNDPVDPEKVYGRVGGLSGFVLVVAKSQHASLFPHEPQTLETCCSPPTKTTVWRSSLKLTLRAI
jgi:hypothetical protein